MTLNKSVASYHHFPDIHATTRILTTFLKPGGSLLVADILKEVDSASPSEPELLEKYEDIVVHKSGFTEDDILRNLAQAGLGDPDFRIVTQAFLHGREVRFFIARGVKPSDD